MTAGMTAAERVDRHFRLYYRAGLDEFEITDMPGHWRRLEPCGGLGACRSMVSHLAYGWEKGFRHTVTYFDPVTRDLASGRFLSPTRTWRELRDAESAVRAQLGEK